MSQAGGDSRGQMPYSSEERPESCEMSVPLLVTGCRLSSAPECLLHRLQNRHSQTPINSEDVSERINWNLLHQPQFNLDQTANAWTAKNIKDTTVCPALQRALNSDFCHFAETNTHFRQGTQGSASSRFMRSPFSSGTLQNSHPAQQNTVKRKNEYSYISSRKPCAKSHEHTTAVKTLTKEQTLNTISISNCISLSPKLFLLPHPQGRGGSCMSWGCAAPRAPRAQPGLRVWLALLRHLSPCGAPGTAGAGAAAQDIHREALTQTAAPVLSENNITPHMIDVFHYSSDSFFCSMYWISAKHSGSWPIGGREHWQ